MITPDYVAIERMRKQGYGEGEGQSYKPWITASRSGSRGVITRHLGGLTGRIHHLLSLLELRCLLLLEWDTDVVDIREQFPLHPIDETREIAAALGYKHPGERRKTRGGFHYHDIVMTTDFRVRLAPGIGAREVMLAVKPASALADDRVLEKLEIERTYAERLGIPWFLVTEAELPVVFTDNLRLILKYRSLEHFPLEPRDIPTHLGELFGELRRSDAATAAVCREFDKRHGFTRGASLTLVWHAIATRAWSVDLSKELNPDRPLVGLQLGRRASATKRQEVA
jgi:hypothetical protein